MLRDNHLTAHIPIIMISADFTAHNPDALKNLTVLTYLYKPISPAYFVLEILKALHIDTSLSMK